MGNRLIACACGCNILFFEYDKNRRKRRFLPNHFTKAGLGRIGKKHSKEAKKKMSVAKKGKKMSAEFSKKQSLRMMGNQINKGRKISESTRKALSRAGKGGNKGSFKKGHIGWNKGKDKGNLIRKKLLQNGKYRDLHYWIELFLGKPSLCEDCGTTKAKRYEWANISRTYKKVLHDWKRLCTSCHRKYDVEYYKK